MPTKLTGMRISPIRLVLARSVLRLAYAVIRAVWRCPGPGRLVLEQPIGRRVPHRSDQAGLGVLVKMAKPENIESGLLVVEQCTPSPVQGTDRGDQRRSFATTDLTRGVIHNRGRDELNGIQRRPGHLDEADLQRDGQTVHRATSASGRRQFSRFQREEVFDLERRERRRKPLSTEIAIIPSRHGHPGGSLSDRTGGAKKRRTARNQQIRIATQGITKLYQ